MSGDPPSLAGVDQLIESWPTPGVIWKLVGCPGTVAAYAGVAVRADTIAIAATSAATNIGLLLILLPELTLLSCSRATAQSPDNEVIQSNHCILPTPIMPFVLPRSLLGRERRGPPPRMPTPCGQLAGEGTHSARGRWIQGRALR